MRIWVPTAQVADALAGLPGVTVEIVNADDGLARRSPGRRRPGGRRQPGGRPAGGTPAARYGRQVEFYVPPFFPLPPSIAAMRQMPRLRWSRR